MSPAGHLTTPYLDVSIKVISNCLKSSLTVSGAYWAKGNESKLCVTVEDRKRNVDVCGIALLKLETSLHASVISSLEGVLPHVPSSLATLPLNKKVYLPLDLTRPQY